MAASLVNGLPSSCITSVACQTFDALGRMYLQSSSIVRQQPRRLDLRRGLGEVVAHLLEVANELAKLFALVRVSDGVVERALRETDHLRGNTNSALVQDFNGDLSADQPSPPYGP